MGQPVMNIAALLYSGIGLYLLVGFVIAIAFVTFGAPRLLPAPAPISVGARLLLVPGAAALWPYVLTRWLKAKP